MVPPIASGFRTFLIRLRERFGIRAIGIVLALLLEAILALVLLTLKADYTPRGESPSTQVFTMDAPSDTPPAPEPAEPAEQPPERTESTPPQPTPPAPPQPDAPVAPPPRIVIPNLPGPPAFIPLSREDMAKADVRRDTPPPGPTAPAPPRRMAMGPPDTGGNPQWADTERVGTAPNGEPLYAAAWYREPYDSELRGYLSTASGPGWALIACRTVPDWRVEDCVSLGESPPGSNIARSVLAAAWQFKVRPPRLGGQSRVGEWVRIRIDYGLSSRREGRR